MSGFERGQSVQAVSVSEEGSFVVDEEAVRRVVTRAETRGLPVAVVAVAGATRGGKSFLLDFLLRYLHASTEARDNGSWVGADDEPLRGFSWRGGSDRDTNGILIWSEPIIVTQELNGRFRKIAVILMDTQGTFDNASTVRDCTTIFAMSTLLSSVQIYNLASIIKEDDLQHLQLFTQYGKLACSASESKPFQSLVFRVRDWMSPFQLPYGTAGGEQYLKTVLEVKENQHQELRELREDIQGSFESISCVLMPHPGFAVTDENFSGRICDLRPEFVESLKEFIPLLFSPKNIIAKSINSQELKTEDLLTYFRTYMAVFNSGELPTPVSILKATGEASLEVGVTGARDVYNAGMQRVTGERAVPRPAVPRLHATALAAAREHFNARKALVTSARVQQRLQELLQELDSNLPHFVELNAAKLQAVLSRALGAYDEHLALVRGARALCVHARDVTHVHAAASDAALVVFDAGRYPPDRGEPDPERDDFKQSLDLKLPELIEANRLANEAACSAAAATYAASMRRALRAGVLGAAALRDAHDRAERAARDEFARARSQGHNHNEDQYSTDLDQKIEEIFTEVQASNRRGNRGARQAALLTYGAYVDRETAGGAAVGRDKLRALHAAASERALREFREERAQDTVNDDEEAALLQELEERYSELRDVNSSRNDALVDAAYDVYTRFMDKKCTPSLASILIVPWLIKVLVLLPRYHEEASDLALQHFWSHRRGADDDDDEYKNRLKEKIAEGYNNYCNPLYALARELGVPINV